MKKILVLLFTISINFFCFSALQPQHKTMTLSNKALEEINTQAYSSKLGARYISKIINDTIKQKLAYELLFGDFVQNDHVTIDFKTDFEYIFKNNSQPKITINKDPYTFKTAQKAYAYAKANPGITITRAEYGDGFIIKDIKFDDEGESFTYTERVKALELKDFEQLLDKSGVTLLDVFGDYKLGQYHKNSDRLIMIIK